MSEQRESVLQAGASSEEVRRWQQIRLRRVLRIVFLVVIPALIFFSAYGWRNDQVWLIAFCGVSFVLAGIMQFWKKAPYVLQAATLVLMLYLLAVLSVYLGGLNGSGQVFLLAAIFVAAIFLGRRTAAVSVGVAVITMGVAGWLFSTGRLAVPGEMPLTTTNPLAWATYTLLLLLVGVLFVLVPTSMLRHWTETLNQSRDRGRELALDREQAQLEAQRQRDHVEQWKWAATLGYGLTSMRQREDLVWRVVREIAQTFDVHQVTLYLLERSGTVLIPAATAGDRGEALPPDGGDILITMRVTPARAAQIGREQMALLLPGELPSFPESRVEISLPLSVRGEVLGVLDIHSLHSTFSEEELQIFRLVANQVAASLDVLRSLEEAQTRLQETQMLYTHHALASWKMLLESRNVPSFTAGKVPEAQVAVLAQEALTALQPRSAWLDDAGMYLLIVPLVIGGGAVGYLAFTRAAEKGAWDVNDRELMTMAAERLAVALDNTRMLMDARQQLLYNERLGQLGDLIWQAPNPEAIMEQSVRELGRFFEASEVQLYLTAAQGAVRPRRGTQPLTSRPEQGEANG
ncbi:MAG TPA: GAF domain-containing protein [Anaerolineae bacterium]|nr:GAF domain-containing protein [Anaerolineae bacterium]HQH37079.1 GAF domain-containing protein [Anaerolineae bacterium]